MDLEHIDQSEPSANQRRDFIKRTAVAGAGLWAAPAILSTARAGAQPASPPPVPGACPTCVGSAFGVSIDGTVATLLVSFGPTPTTSGGIICGSPVLAGVVELDTVCVEVTNDAGFCTATAEIASVNILSDLITTGVITSIASFACDCSTLTVDSEVVGLTVAGFGAVAISGAPNQVIASISVETAAFTTAEINIVANRQSCVGGTVSVDALVIDVEVVFDPPLLPPTTVTEAEIIISHAQVNNGCPCPVPFP